MATFGEVLNRLRKERGLSMDELAEKAGTTKNSIYRIEHGEQQNIGLDLVKSLSKALGVKPYVLMGEEPEFTVEEAVELLVDQAKELKTLKESSANVVPIQSLSEDERDLLTGFRKLTESWKLFWLYLISRDEKYRTRLKKINPNAKPEKVLHVLDVMDRK